MKKSLPILSVAGIALLLACASCSDDVVNQGITLPEGVPSEVTLGYDNEIKTIPVNAAGDWKATVVYDGVSDPEETVEWLGLLSDSGSESDAIHYVADANNTPDFRSARIILECGDDRLEYKVSQQPVGYGDDNADLDMSMFGFRIPLGYGIRMRQPNSGSGKVSNVLLNQVFVLDAMHDPDPLKQTLMKDFSLNPQNYVRVDTTTDAKMEVIRQEAAEEATRQIGANLKVTVAYGLFKLNLNGDFRMFGSSTDSTYCYSAMSTPNKGAFTMNEGAIDFDLMKLQPDPADNPTVAKNKKSAELLMLSNNFIKLRDAIEECVAKDEKYDKETKNTLFRKLKALDNSFGPAYIRTAEVGASAELTYNFARKEGTDTLKIHGDLTLGLNSLLSLDVSASADYDNYMKSHLEEASFRYRIKGGDPDVACQMGENLAGLMNADTKISPEIVTQKLNDWAKTVRMGNVTCLSYYPTPIWTLFSDDAAEEVMHYFWDAYPNNPDGGCPYTFDVQLQIENKNGGY